MPAGPLLQVRPVELAGVDRCHPAGRDRDQRRGPDAALEMGSLSEQGTWPALGQRLVIPLDPDDPVQDKVDIGPWLSLALARPPAVCENRTQPCPGSGSRRKSGSWTA